MSMGWQKMKRYAYLCFTKNYENNEYTELSILIAVTFIMTYPDIIVYSTLPLLHDVLGPRGHTVIHVSVIPELVRFSGLPLILLQSDLDRTQFKPSNRVVNEVRIREVTNAERQIVLYYCPTTTK